MRTLTKLSQSNNKLQSPFYSCCQAACAPYIHRLCEGSSSSSSAHVQSSRAVFTFLRAFQRMMHTVRQCLPWAHCWFVPTTDKANERDKKQVGVNFGPTFIREMTWCVSKIKFKTKSNFMMDVLQCMYVIQAYRALYVTAKYQIPFWVYSSFRVFSWQTCLVDLDNFGNSEEQLRRRNYDSAKIRSFSQNCPQHPKRSRFLAN